MATLPVTQVTAAARALMLAGRWSQATAMLDAAAPADDAERVVLAVAAAEVAVDQDFWLRTGSGSPALTRAATVAGGAGGAGAVVSWDLDFVRLRHDYDVQLFGSGDAEPSWGPEGRDLAVLDRLAARAVALRDRAPDRARQARAAFYAGLIADNLRGDAVAGREFFEQARLAGEDAGDDLIVSYALRHLAFGLAQSGDVAQAKLMNERSMELRQQVGCVPHVLAQQLALAELAQTLPASEGGDAAWAAAVAGLVLTWARGLEGDTWLVPAAEALLSGEALLGGEAGQVEQVVEDAID
jgi:hypothetical protein